MHPSGAIDMASSDGDKISVRTENNSGDSSQQNHLNDDVIEVGQMQLADNKKAVGMKGIKLDFDKLPKKSMRQLYRENKMTTDPMKLE